MDTSKIGCNHEKHWKTQPELNEKMREHRNVRNVNVIWIESDKTCQTCQWFSNMSLSGWNPCKQGNKDCAHCIWPNVARHYEDLTHQHGSYSCFNSVNMQIKYEVRIIHQPKIHKSSKKALNRRASLTSIMIHDWWSKVVVHWVCKVAILQMMANQDIWLYLHLKPMNNWKNTCTPTKTRLCLIV